MCVFTYLRSPMVLAIKWHYADLRMVIIYIFIYIYNLVSKELFSLVLYVCYYECHCLLVGNAGEWWKWTWSISSSNVRVAQEAGRKWTANTYRAQVPSPHQGMWFTSVMHGLGLHQSLVGQRFRKVVVILALWRIWFKRNINFLWHATGGSETICLFACSEFICLTDYTL